jgi:SAM-dependent methyltransferase
MFYFRHGELRYYSFGLKAGLSNLLTNGSHLGLKKTTGKITQPVTWYSRFPEFYHFDRAITAYLDSFPGRKPVILDIGSPKLFGMYLAHTRKVDVELADVDPSALVDYEAMWDSLKHHAKGTVSFSRRDARSLQLPDAAFDIVFSMSVIEHVEGEAADSRAVRELLRVLKPGGLLALSVPFGHAYAEQDILRRVELDHRNPSSSPPPRFFQRIYDETSFDSRILSPAAGLETVSLTTVGRKHAWMHRWFAGMTQNIRGLCGFMHPVLSACVNESSIGIGHPRLTDYGSRHSVKDIYADLIMTGLKSGVSPSP